MIQSTDYIKNYNSMAYPSRLVKYSDYIANKYNIVHKKLYSMAIDKYINEWIKVKKMLIEIDVLEDKKNSTTNYQEKVQINNKIKKYKSFISKHKDDKKFIEGKYIYNVNSLEEFKNNCMIYEIMNDEYWKPSRCKIVTKFKNKLSPNLTWQVDLTPYWNTYQEYSNQLFTNKKLSNDNFKDAKIVEINYVKGKARIYSENIDKSIEVDFDDINGNDIDIDDDLTLINTFTDLRKKLQE